MNDNNDLSRISQLIKNKIKYKELKLDENLQFLETLIETIPNAIFYKDSNFIYRYCNNTFLEFLGLKREEVIGHSVYDISPKELADTYNKADAKLFEGKSNQIYESEVVYKDKTKHNVIFNKAVVINKKGKAVGIVGIIIDITERKRDEIKVRRLLKIKEAMLQINYSIIEMDNIVALFELILEKVMKSMESSCAGIVSVLDSNGYLNTVAYRGFDEKIPNISLKKVLFRKKIDDSISKPTIFNNLHEIESDKLMNQVNSLLGGKMRSSIYSPIIIQDKLYGVISIFSKNASDFDKIDLETMNHVKSQVEIAINNHVMYEKIIYLSRYDKLTDLYNRAYFEELFHKCLKKSLENNKEFFLVIFDLNELKPINDIYGHFIGDELIKMFAENIKNMAGANDILGRIGGDEFSAICFEKDEESLIKKFESLLDYLKINQLTLNENKINCSFSYGIAKFPQEGSDYSTLMNLADKRMYNYKRNSRKT